MTANVKGISTSYLIGTPIGLLTIFIVFLIPAALTGEGLAPMGMVAVYCKSIVGLIISFLIALGVGGHNVVKDLRNQKSLIKTSFRYSLTVNAIVWSVFIFLTILDNNEGLLTFLLPPIIAFVFCTAITTFTLGLLICYTIKKRQRLRLDNDRTERNTAGNTGSCCTTPFYKKSSFNRGDLSDDKISTQKNECTNLGSLFRS